MALHINFSSEECMSYSETLTVINSFCNEVAKQTNTEFLYSEVYGRNSLEQDEQGEIKPFDICVMNFVDGECNKVLELVMDPEQVDDYNYALKDKEALRELINQLPIKR